MNTPEHTPISTSASEAAVVIAEALEPHASPEAMNAFKEAAAASGNTVDESLPHLQELLRLTVEHLSLRRPGIDTSGALQRLADGSHTPEDIDQLNLNAMTEPIAYVLDGDWDFPAVPGLAVALYLHGNPAIDRGVVDAALAELAAFLNSPESVEAQPAPVRDIILISPAGRPEQLIPAETDGDYALKAA